MSSQKDDKEPSPNELADIWRRFLEGYVKPKDHQKEVSEKYQYMVRLRKMRAAGSHTLIIDYLDVVDADDMSRGNSEDNKSSEYTDLVKTLRKNPKIALEGAKHAAIELLGKIDPDYLTQMQDEFGIAIWNLDHEVDIAKISHENVNKLAQMVGIVLTRQDPLHYLKEACYICDAGHSVMIQSKGTEHWKPRECSEDSCGSDRMELDEDNSNTDVFQVLRIQQGYDSAEPGVSRDIEVICIGKDLIDRVKPGDFVVVTGIIDVDRRNTRQQGNSLGKFRMECLWIDKKAEEFVVDDPVLEKDVANAVMHDDTPEDKLEDAGFNRLVASICPSIKGNEVVRMALLLQLAGTDTKTLPDQTHIRGDINTLLCGDSATGKSKMARFMLKCFNRAVFSVGRGSTTAGLKAAIVFDKLTGAARLEAGAYLLANGGVVYVDELEKTERQQREDLAETMDDEQTITIHKATIHKEMAVRVASLHVCNPVNGGVWMKNKNIFENTGFEPWHLTRYDAIFVFMDEPDEEADRAKWTHYLKHYDMSITDADLQDNKKIALTKEDLKSAVFLRLWGQYVRRKFHPRLRPGSKAEEILREEWIRLRQLSQKSYERKIEEAKAKDEDPNEVERSQIISMREIGGLLRFAEASARAHHRDEVTEKDAGIAMSILSEFMTRAGFNPATGEMMVPYFQVKEKDEDIMKTIKAQREKFRRIAEDLSLAPCPRCKRKKRVIDRENSIDPQNPDIIDCPACGARGLIEIEFREDDFVRECRDAKLPDKFINKQLNFYKVHGFLLDSNGKLKLDSKNWYQSA